MCIRDRASTQAVTEESIPLLIQGVLESAALIETDEQDAILPPDDSYSSVCNASQAVTAITAEQKIALARDIDAKLRSDDPRLTPDTCAVATGEETFTLKNTLGLDLSHHSNMIYAMADVVARDGEHVATDYETRWGYGLDAIDAETLAESCKRESLMKLKAGRMKSGAYPVVIKNTAMADLLATFCGVFSADNAQKGLSLLAGREGEAVASASVTLTDDPLMPMGLASCPFDREGAATKTKAVIENGVDCGPRAYLRPGTHMLDGSKAGTHVEIKKSTIGEGSKVPHLSYIGDTTMGSGVNVGAGSITCNYDGVHKHKTVIGKDAFIGSDTMMVAPAQIGDGALVAAGSVITEPVPADALGLGRARQVNIEGWAADYRRRLHEDDEV